jgi:two-component system sensor histidine kinase UhpB
LSAVDIGLFIFYQKRTMTLFDPDTQPTASPSSASQPPGGARTAASPGVNEAIRMSLPGDLRGAAAPSSFGRGHAQSRQSKRRSHAEDARFAAVREDERQQIAQQIHDDLGGVLTGLKACISVVMDRATRAGAAPDPLLVDAAALADLAFQTVRKIAMNLSPPMLEQMTIWTALECQVTRLSRRTGIDIDFSIDPNLASIALGEARMTAVFRLICEALTNIEKHSQASRGSVRVAATGRSLSVTVSDNGIGLRQGAYRSGMTLGISGMSEQAKRFGGELVLTTDCDGGTVVQLAMPLGLDDGA